MSTKWLKINAHQNHTIPAAPGVYVVYLSNNVVYVGQSNNLRVRFARHNIRFGYASNLITPWGEFPATKKLEIKAKLSRRVGDWAMLEIRLIHRLRPRFNFIHASRRAMALT